ncbi:MAG: hypothetical protein JSV86_18495 [Gemmatimonadota bacterium]|nr:MAG: hypothetical protein JSV86_18495 [Gemmatimonadota bacterium]
MSQRILRLSPSGPYADMADVMAADGLGVLRGLYYAKNGGAVVISSTRVFDVVTPVRITIGDQEELERTRVAIVYSVHARMDGVPSVVLFSPTIDQNGAGPVIMESPAYRAVDDGDTTPNVVCNISYSILKGNTGGTDLGTGAPLVVGTNDISMALQGADTVTDGDLDAGKGQMLLAHFEGGSATSTPN